MSDCQNDSLPDAFGGRQSESGSSKDTDASETTEASEDMVTSLGQAAMFSCVQLCAALLKWDFKETWNKDFQKSTLTVLVAHFQIPEKTAQAVFQMLESDSDVDIAPYITTVKADPLVAEGNTSIISADLIALFVNNGSYDARHRVLIRFFTALLAVDWEVIEEFENSLADSMLNKKYEETETPAIVEPTRDELKARKKRERNKKIRRYVMIGAGGTIGGVLIGLTGGLAAPLFAAGAGVFLGTAAAAGIATTAGAAVIGSLFGVAGAGLAGYKMNKRVGALKEFAIETLSTGTSMHLTICVSGWITEDREDAFSWAWRHINLSKEQYCVRFESEYMLQLGNAVNYLTSFAVNYAITSVLMETALAGLLTAVAWPSLILTTGCVVDNPWNVCVKRAEEAGLQLAQLLLSRQQGHRPVTLLGFSLGARVVYFCLLELAKRNRSAGIIEDVVLLGAPVTGSEKEWRKICTVVAGRIINGYSKTDWMLKFLYRTMNAQYSIAGTAPVHCGESKVVNFDLTHLVTGHLDYQHKLRAILEAVGIRVHPAVSSGNSGVFGTPSASPLHKAAVGVATNFPNSASTRSLQQLPVESSIPP